MSTIEHNPLHAAREFANGLTGTPVQKAEKLEDYDALLIEARKGVALLRESFRMQAAAFEPDGTESPTESGLARYTSRNPTPSLRKACVAAVLFSAVAPTAAGVLAALEQAKFRFGKGFPGDLVRSALWQATKKQRILRRGAGGRYFLHSKEAADAFVREEGLTM